MKELLAQLADTTSRAIKKRAELLDEIRVELKSHTTIEEEIFYPAFRTAGNKSDDASMYFEAIEEHRAAGDLVLPDLFSTPVDSEKFSGARRYSRNWSLTMPTRKKRKCLSVHRSCLTRMNSSIWESSWRSAKSNSWLS